MNTCDVTRESISGIRNAHPFLLAAGLPVTLVWGYFWLRLGGICDRRLQPWLFPPDDITLYSIYTPLDSTMCIIGVH